MTKKSFSLVLLFWVSLFLASAALADDRAEEILKNARAAIGGEAAVLQVQSLSVKGEYRRILGEREMSGDREISIQLPDKYLLEDSFSQGGFATSLILSRGLNGAHAWNGTSGGGGGVFIKMGAVNSQQATPEQIEEALRRQHQNEFNRYLLAMLTIAPPSADLTYKYAGESEVDDAKADVVDISDAAGFAVRLFFDKQSHLPLLLSYQGPKPRIMTNFQRVDKGSKSDKKADPDELKKAAADAEKKMTISPEEKPEKVDFFIRLNDYKKVGGLLLPHKLTFLTQSEVSEEFVISKYQLNPQFKSDKFEKH